ncbi:hypothetical protein [Vibrio owensii]|uniref:hypothetical protein n=1 Tax=Vibrio owensii TaxID=696485 RepID=UPI0018F1FCA4|nr:hypothetical protein [Vibrio owensii]
MEKFELGLFPQFCHFSSRQWVEVREMESGEALYEGKRVSALKYLWELCEQEKYFTKREKPQRYVVFGELDGVEYCEEVFAESADEARSVFATGIYLNADDDVGAVTVSLVVNESLEIEHRSVTMWRESLILWPEMDY